MIEYVLPWFSLKPRSNSVIVYFISQSFVKDCKGYNKEVIQKSINLNQTSQKYITKVTCFWIIMLVDYFYMYLIF